MKNFKIEFTVVAHKKYTTIVQADNMTLAEIMFKNHPDDYNWTSLGQSGSDAVHVHTLTDLSYGKEAV